MNCQSLVVILPLLFLISCAESENPVTDATANLNWYKGNLHTHSLWSDGDDYPEMIMDWYKSHGYDFIALSDHNILQEGEKWITVPNNTIRRSAFQEYLQTFGEGWVDYKEDGEELQVRLKQLEEYRGHFEVADSFLIIKSEEITDAYEGKPIHLNATNIDSLIEPQHGNSVAEVMQNNINAVLEQRKKSGQPMFPHINHPNFGWAITAEDMIQLENERFFEVYNGHPLVNNYGDSTHLGTEAMWDLINTAYAKVGKPLMFGLATDDSHNYHTFGLEFSNSGRGWVMVQAAALTPIALIEAMEAGNFYATTGVTLKRAQPGNNTYTIQVEPEEGIHYTIQFLGVTDASGKAKILQEVNGTVAEYNMTGKELFVRAKVISDKPKENPFNIGDVETAWTQPMLVNKGQ